MIARIEELKHQLHKYRKWEPLVFFAGGFSFDALLLHRIDNPVMLVHQAIYLTLSALIISWDLIADMGAMPDPAAPRRSVPAWVAKAWSYREGILHFMLGTLLNVYTIFYFKSGSFFSSLVFLALLGLLLYLNEVRPPKLSKHFLRNSLFALCLVSYLNIVVAILVGSTGWKTFGLGIVAACAVHAGFVTLLKRRIHGPRIWLEIRAPFYIIAAIYVSLYFARVLPPVPLSIKYMGIYRQVSKSGDDYQLAYEHPNWQFWKHGDQTFYARPGDKIYCFIQIFSPARFKDQLFVRWQFKDPRNGWQSWDAIPLGIVGGREEGYRGYTTKTNYQPGKWRVSVETQDGREVGRLSLDIEATEPNAPADLKYDIR